jgi:hypothetical protein
MDKRLIIVLAALAGIAPLAAAGGVDEVGSEQRTVSNER